MQLELNEFSEIVEGEWSGGRISGKLPTREELTRALQVLLTRQCIYSSTPGIGRAYDIAKAYSDFFERYFAALGYRLQVSQRDQMVALSVPVGESRYDSVYERLRKDETIVLLALRLMWEEAVANQDVGDGGIAETTTGDLIDRIKNVIHADPPEEARLNDILRRYQRHGTVRIGERDRTERVSPLTILPGVAVVVPDAFLENLKLWAVTPDAAPPDTNSASVVTGQTVGDEVMQDIDLSQLFPPSEGGSAVG